VRKRRNPFSNLLSAALLLALAGAALAGDGLPPKRLPPRTRAFRLRVEGRLRSYLVHRPPSRGETGPMPVVIMLHGGGGTGRGALWETRWNEKADAEGFLAVFPEGTPPNPFRPGNFLRNPQTWNDGSKRSALTAVQKGVEDVAFLRALIDELEDRFSVDARRIYVTGFSNGASMTFRAGRELSGRIAAIAPVAGIDWMADTEPERFVPLIYLTGTDDPLNPMQGGEIRLGRKSYGVKPPTREMIERWVERAVVPGEPRTICDRDGAKGLAWGREGEETAVVLYTFEGHGHHWPGGRSALPAYLAGRNTARLSATDLVWAFFEKHALPEDAPALSRPPAWVTPAVRAEGLHYRTFRSEAAGAEVSYHVFTPPGYGEDDTRRFPVLYWLHGSGGGGAGIRPLTERFGDAMREGRAPSMLVVFPNGLPHGLWCDSKDGRTKVETLLMQDLIPDVEANFRTVARREGRMIEGFSMGGYGAARIGFKFPERFRAVSILGGGPLQKDLSYTPRVGPRNRERTFAAVYGSDQDYFYAQSPWHLAEKNADALREGMTIRQVVGAKDETLPANRDFHDRLAELRIGHDYVEVPGIPHDPAALLDAMGNANWGFYRAVFGEGDEEHPDGLDSKE